jgi:hypothetical protein
MLICCPLCKSQISINNIIPLTDVGKTVYISCDNCNKEFSIKTNKRFLDLKIKRGLCLGKESIDTIAENPVPEISTLPNLELKPIADTQSQADNMARKFLKVLGFSKDA